MTGKSAVEYLEAIERPLKFLATAGSKQFQTVKNLSTHVMEVSQKALAASLPELEVRRFRALQELFVGFDEFAEKEKRDRIQKALDLISEPKRNHAPTRYLPEDHMAPDSTRLKSATKNLSKSIQFFKGVGPAIADKFAKAEIRTVNDLFFFFPTRYEDRRVVTSIGRLEEGKNATVVGKVKVAGVAFYRGLRRRTFEAVLEDETGSVKLKWFHFYMGTIDQKIKRDIRLIAHGKVTRYKNKFEMHHPDFEIDAGPTDSLSFGRIVPVYREIGGLYQKTLRKILSQAIATSVHERVCALPPDICQRNDLLPPWKALREIHVPAELPNPDLRTDAQKSLSFEELFFYCLSLALRKQLLQKRPGISFGQPSPRFEGMLKKIPFELTTAQTEVLKVIRRDMEQPKPMNRLLQGDVGSGKTVVAFLSALVAIDHGYQAIFMAPTEILAEQHYKTLSKWASDAGIEIELLTGRTPAKTRSEILKNVKEGNTHVLVGTHALLEADVAFKKVGLVVVDEQHRFGVRQRAVIRGKGEEPDVLVMSATPIPRTLALTLYGDLDVSILNELPKGRKPITTRAFRESEREKVYDLIRKEVEKGHQIYVVYPLVETSDKIELKDATTMAETLSKEVFKDLQVALLHGQLKGSEKESLMKRFSEGKIDILVATTVIEVGIDVPNATVMLIEHPERFGLSQLHQLRGRVGRGSDQSHCLLLTPPRISQMARDRVSLFSKVQDGFLLAEEDLRLRGPGDFFGHAQSGFPQFEIALFPRDLDLLERARREAFSILDRDPGLEGPDHKHLKWMIEEAWAERVRLVRVG